MKGRPPKSFTSLNLMDMYVHCQKLYTQSNVGAMPHFGSLSHSPSLFSVEDIEKGLKKLATRKAGDLQGIK